MEKEKGGMEGKSGKEEDEKAEGKMFKWVGKKEGKIRIRTTG